MYAKLGGMRSPKTKLNTRELECHHCRGPISWDNYLRVPVKGLAGANWAVCSPECATAVAAIDDPFVPPVPEREWKVEPMPGTDGACGCGCGGTPKGGRYLPGHDARLKAQRRKEVSR